MILFTNYRLLLIITLECDTKFKKAPNDIKFGLFLDSSAREFLKTGILTEPIVLNHLDITYSSRVNQP